MSWAMASVAVELPSGTKKRLRRLAERIPAVAGCGTGCSDCCIAAPWSVAEAALVAADPRAVGIEWTVLFDDRRRAMSMLPSRPGRESVRCPFVAPEGGCSIYDVRPMVCRLYGAVQPGRMDCPHGRRAARPLSVCDEGRVMAEYLSLCAESARQLVPPVPIAVPKSSSCRRGGTEPSLTFTKRSIGP